MTTPLLLERDATEEWALEDDLGCDEVGTYSTSALGAAHREPDRESQETRELFAMLADELAQATTGLSSTRRATRHPAYTEILAIGPDAVPLLIERLARDEHRPLWLTLLGSLTGLPPGAGEDTIPASAAAWMRLHRAMY
jgi:hypothetical protein